MPSVKGWQIIENSNTKYIRRNINVKATRETCGFDVNGRKSILVRVLNVISKCHFRPFLEWSLMTHCWFLFGQKKKKKYQVFSVMEILVT